MSLFYHEPCHSRVLDSRQPALQLLKLIPGVQIETAPAVAVEWPEPMG